MCLGTSGNACVPLKSFCDVSGSLADGHTGVGKPTKYSTWRYVILLVVFTACILSAEKLVLVTVYYCESAAVF